MFLRMGLALLGVVAIALAFAVPDAKGFREPALARMIFFHLPCAFLGAGFLVAGSVYGLNYLRGRKPGHADRSLAANELGFLFTLLTLVTGILFSRTQWGAWWQWDPRQTSFLMLCLLYAAYFALRGAFADGERREAVAAGYSLALALPAIFLIFVYPRLPHVVQTSFHPSQTIAQGQFDMAYRSVLYLNFIFLLLLAIWLFRQRIALTAAERRLEILDANHDPRGTATRTRPVRVVRLPDGDQSST